MNAGSEKNNREKKPKIEEIVEKKINSDYLISMAEPLYKSDEFLDALSTVIDDMGDFNVDELLKAESERFNLSEVRI